MTTEALYYNTINAGLATLLSGRVYPIKLPQNTAFPALLYSVGSAETDGYMELGDTPPFLYQFDNVFYATSYAKIIEITDKLREVCSAMNWNVTSFADGNYDEDLKTFSRAVTITVVY